MYLGIILLCNITIMHNVWWHEKSSKSLGMNATLTGSFAAFQKLNVTIWRMLKTMASIRQAIRKLFSVLTTGISTHN